MELGGAINIQFGVGHVKDANFDTDEQQLWWSNHVPHKMHVSYSISSKKLLVSELIRLIFEVFYKFLKILIETNFVHKLL